MELNYPATLILYSWSLDLKAFKLICNRGDNNIQATIKFFFANALQNDLDDLKKRIKNTR
jgi:hypothetical protein